MAIIDHEVITNRIQGSGLRKVRFRFTDSSGRTIDTGAMRVDAGTDLDALAVSNYTKIYDDEVNGELDRLALRIFKGGGDSLEINNVGDFATVKQRVRHILKAVLSRNDPRLVVSIKPFFLAFNTQFPTTQDKADFLGVSLAKAQKLTDRVRAVLNPPVSTQSLEDMLTAFDAEAGEL